MGISENLGFGVEALCKKKRLQHQSHSLNPSTRRQMGKPQKIKAPQLPGSLSIEEVGELT